MAFFVEAPIGAIAAVFAGAALTILFAGWKLSDTADKLADATGMGEAMAGAVLLGATTSLPGLLTSGVTASNGYAELAFNNAVGGIAAQTAFLAIADISYRRVNLEHAAASASNAMQAALLIGLLSLPIVAIGTPSLELFAVHPLSLALPCCYLYGMRMVARARRSATWKPVETPETDVDEPDRAYAALSVPRLLGRFLSMATVVGLAGWLVAESGMALVARTGLSESLVGGVFTAVATSLPELVTTLMAVRLGALTLAVGNILGGNSFDTLFIAVADIAYHDGPIYRALEDRQLFLLGVVLLMNAVLMLGLLRRQKKGIGNIGFESFTLLVLYAGALFLLTL